MDQQQFSWLAELPNEVKVGIFFSFDIFRKIKL